MNKYQIAVIVGSLRRDSINRQLADTLASFGPADIHFGQIQIRDLPLYNQDDETDPVEAVRRFKADISAADGLLFVTPEYNRSIPGALKNAIDHASRPYGKSVWAGKPAGVIGASVGAGGSAMAQQHLRNILAYLDVPTLAQPEAFIHVTEGYFDKEGKVSDLNRAFLKDWLDRYLDWVRRFVQ
jgi:chromate reductase, NAD(P)H dehydrogenase (quinone)